MKTPYRIGYDLFDDNVKLLINASAKIFPVAYSYVTDNLNPLKYDYVRVVDVEHRNEVYIWDVNKFTLIGADDTEVSWTQIKDKPLVYSPDLHNHDSSYYTKAEIDTSNNTKVDKVEGKALSTNDFDNTYKTKLESLSNNASVDYQTMSNQLTSHSNDLDIHVTSSDKAEIAKISSKSDKTYVDNALASKTDSSTFNGHIENSTIHVSQTDKDAWNIKTQITQGTVQPTSGYWFKEV